MYIQCNDQIMLMYDVHKHNLTRKDQFFTVLLNVEDELLEYCYTYICCFYILYGYTVYFL